MYDDESVDDLMVVGVVMVMAQERNNR